MVKVDSEVTQSATEGSVRGSATVYHRETKTGRLLYGPELRLQIKLVHALNKTADIVAENFKERLVDLRDLGSASQTISKLRLDHREGRFDVAALVVLLEKPFLVVAVVVIHPTPKFTLASPFRPFVYSPVSRKTPLGGAIRLERYVWHRCVIYYGLKVRR